MGKAAKSPKRKPRKVKTQKTLRGAKAFWKKRATDMFTPTDDSGPVLRQLKLARAPTILLALVASAVFSSAFHCAHAGINC
eukprot:2131406-Alexandrium_andersonii.AAC.1